MEIETIENAAKSPLNGEAAKTEKDDASTVADVVVLDDDETTTVCELIDLVRNEMTGNTKCINYSCKGGTDMLEPPGFCLSYYRVRNKVNKKQQICYECYETAVEHYDRLAEAVVDKKPLYEVEMPFRNDVVEIDDSDSDEEANNEKYISADTIGLLEQYFDSTMMDVLERYNFDDQIKQSVEILDKKTDEIKESFEDVQAMFRSIRSDTDKMIFELSDVLRPENMELPALDITDSKVQIVRNQQTKTRTPAKSNVGKATGTKVLSRSSSTTQDSVKSASSEADSNLVVLQESDNEEHLKAKGLIVKSEADEPPSDLPPKTPVVKPALKVDEMYYANRSGMIGAWVKVRLTEILPPGTKREGQVYNQTMYLVSIENKQKMVTMKVLTGKEIAYSTPYSSQLDVGARVIAVFHEIFPAGEMKKKAKDSYYPGIIAEPLQAANKYRYLIFFDDGYAQYVAHNCVHLIYEVSADVWEDVNINSRTFIKKYLEKYPDRPMVKLLKDQTVRTEYNGKWWVTTVMNVDCSLVQMFFDASSRVEWIYRGSTRLNPMFKEEQAATSRLQHRQRITRKANSSSAPYVQYTRTDMDGSSLAESEQNQQQQQQRSVARKSTARPTPNNMSVNSFLPNVPNVPNDMNREVPATKIVYYTPRRQKPKTNIFNPHTCVSKCKDFMYCALSRLKGYSPLSKPLLCGFYRLLCKARNKKLVVYKSPCGRTLRNMNEVHLYLQLTKSDLTVDLFDFNVFVRCLAEFMVEQKNILVKDLSAGLEECPITVVNYVDASQLDFCNYSTKREPMEGVDLNVDPEFLCGCDCVDDCIDRTKCSCWQLTLNCLKYMDKDTDPNSVGYQNRRLPEQIFSGIYECNSRCKCASTCLNRVVQNPLQHKLQVFKTDARGWGIRCLNDIPQGSFVCIYAGALLTDDMANQGGKSYGDEYLAELDFIETAERTKEDYEEEAYQEDDVRVKTPEESGEEDTMEEDEDNITDKDYGLDRDFIPSFMANRSVDTSGIRSRLRKRNIDQAGKAPQDVRKGHDKLKPMAASTAASNALVTGPDDDDTVMISDDEEYEPREPSSFNPKSDSNLDDSSENKYKSVRDMFGEDEAVYIMDAKNTGNIGRFLNHSCSPNIFVQNVFVDTHDVRFPWVSFFAMSYIRAGTELTWNYNYDVGSVPGKVMYCYCGSAECKGRLL